MENLKVKVTTEQESKEVQELFFELGFAWLNTEKTYHDIGENPYISSFKYSNRMELGMGGGPVDHKELTIPQLREMVRLKKYGMKETEYLMQGKNGERLMESAGQLKSSQWDLQVGGDHYKSMKIQPAKFALENKLDYCQANAIKYICRHESKNGKQDLEKAKHYIDLLIEHYYGDQNAI